MKSRLSLAALVCCLTALADAVLPGQRISAVPPLPPVVRGSSDPAPKEPTHAVVRIISHGASATVIATEAGRSLLLGCGHAYQGAERRKPMVIDVPTQSPLPSGQKVGIFLLDVDYEADLSLVQLNAGPLEVCAPVAPGGHHPGPHVLSIGYDQMRLPPVQMHVSIVQQSPATTYTAQRPGHGRSGGALLDSDAGYLIGVVQGYEVTSPRRGMYVSHQAILNFLRRAGGVNSLKPLPSQPSLPYYLCPPSG